MPAPASSSPATTCSTWRPPESLRRHRHQSLHPRRNAPRPHVSQCYAIIPIWRGHYGSAWQNQKTRVRRLPRPHRRHHQLHLIPPASYSGRMFTTRATAVPGATRIVDEISPPSSRRPWPASPARANMRRKSTVGFHRTVLLDAAPAIVQAVKDKKIIALLTSSAAATAHEPRPQLLQRLRRQHARAIPSSSPSAAASTASASTTTARSWASRACWTWASATTPTAPSWSPSPGQRLRLLRQRPAADAVHQLVRAEGRGRAADTSVAGRQRNHRSAPTRRPSSRPTFSKSCKANSI